MSSEDTNATSPLSWRVHPARQRPWAAAMAVGVIAALAAAAAFTAGRWWGPATVVVLLLALQRFFFPSQFAIDERGVTARYLFGTQRLAWCDVRRLQTDGRGAYLSTRSRPSRMDASRGMHLQLGAEPKQVLARIRAAIGQRGGGA